MNLKPIKNPAVRWGELEDSDKHIRIAAVMNQLFHDSTKPIKSATRYMKTYDVHSYIFRAMVELNYLAVKDRVYFECNYGVSNEAKLVDKARNVFTRAKEITNKYGQANAAKKKASKLAKLEANRKEASKPIWTQDITKEAKVQEIAQNELKKVLADVMPEVVKNIKVKVDVEFNIKWRIL